MATNPAINSVITRTKFVLSERIATKVRAAVAEAVTKGGASERLTQFGDGLSSSIGGRAGKSSLANAHRDVAAGMQQAVLASYAQRVTARKRIKEPYRVGQNRFSGGALRRALKSENMVSANHDGIAFVNKDILDAEARHWYRLNYGAGARGATNNAKSYRLKLFGSTISQISDPGGPSGAFKMPRGIWGGNESAKGAGFPAGFYPTGVSLVVPTQGIAARRYLDAGLAYLAKNLGPRYEELLDEWIDQAERGKGPLSKTVHIK